MAGLLDDLFFNIKPYQRILLMIPTPILLFYLVGLEVRFVDIDFIDRVLRFDAFALVAITHQGARSAWPNQTIDWRASLIRDEGFSGLSGRFNLLPDGQNQRYYEIRTLIDNQLVAR